MALHVVLVEPEIHWNTGNAGRTCLAAGAQLHLVEPLGFSLGDRELRRAGLDYWPLVKPRVWPSFAALEVELAALGDAFFLSAEGGRSLWDVPFPSDTVLLFGKESVGFSADVKERHRERLVSIPMRERALRSLNLSTAVGIAAFEALRQRSLVGP